MTSTSRRLLIVDDDVSLLRATARVLNAAGFETTLSANGAQAIAHLRDDPPDAVVLDWRMPGLDGIDILRQIREHNQEVPVILVTGYPEIAIAVIAIQEGADDFLARPIADELLVRRVQRAIELRSLRTENDDLRTRLGHAPSTTEDFPGGIEISIPVRTRRRFSVVMRLAKILYYVAVGLAAASGWIVNYYKLRGQR